MALSDIIIYDDGIAHPGAKRFKVNNGGPAGINAGELVLKPRGATANTGGRFVTKWGTSVATKPSAGTDYIAGIAASTSTETLTLTGTVDVWPNSPGMTYLITPNNTATFGVGSTPVQATYDALVGAQVLLNSSASGVQTLLATDNTHAASANNGAGSALVVEPLDVFKYPGKVRFSILQVANYNN